MLIKALQSLFNQLSSLIKSNQARRFELAEEINRNCFVLNNSSCRIKFFSEPCELLVEDFESMGSSILALFLLSKSTAGNTVVLKFKKFKSSSI